MAQGYKTGGRRPQQPDPTRQTLKQLLQQHSLSYFKPKEQLDSDGNLRTVSDFEIDIEALAPAERLPIEIKVLEFHTPRMKTEDVNLLLNTQPLTIEDTLTLLSRDPDADPADPDAD